MKWAGRRLCRALGVGATMAAASIVAVLLALPLLTTPAGAATDFAIPAFKTQWTAGEVITPNFWGPLALAKEGQTEPYKEGSLDYSESGPTNPGQGQRLVQYFDKARMELTNPARGDVTNGLLASELIYGRVQTGDNTFEQRQPAAVAIAGDADNPGPTYAMIYSFRAQLLVPVTATVGEPVIAALTPTGTPIRFDAGANYPQAKVGAYDATTGHNVPAAFAQFRDRAKIATIGLAITEPFWSNVRVGGQPKDVLMQAFERRVLTFTPANADPYKVEFGNIGAQYYAWRYGTSGGTFVPPPGLPVKPPSATLPPTSMSSSRAACAAPARAVFGTSPVSIARNTPVTLTATLYDDAGNVCGDGTRVAIADTGTLTTFAGGGKAPNGASYVIVTVTNGVATATITVTSAVQPSASGPVSVNVYRVTPSTDIAGGGFGIPLVTPSYAPAVT